MINENQIKIYSIILITKFIITIYLVIKINLIFGLLSPLKLLSFNKNCMNKFTEKLFL